MNLIIIIVVNINRQNEGVDYIDYTHHYSSDEQEEGTDYDVPPKQYKSIRFNKETHPLSLMVHTHTCMYCLLLQISYYSFFC